MDALTLAISNAGSQSNLARKLTAHTGRTVLSQHIVNWRKRGVPSARCPEIEAVTGVTCEQLKPDVQWRRDAAGAVVGHLVGVS